VTAVVESPSSHTGRAIGVLGIAVWLLIFAVAGGLPGVLIALGLAAIVLGTVALIRGRVSWAWLPNRRVAGVAFGAGLVLVMVGGLLAPSEAAPQSMAPSNALPDAVTPTSPTAVTTTPTPTEVASPAATPTAPPSPTLEPGTALAVAAALVVKGRAPKTGYQRADFGPAWTDDALVPDGHNGCDTRNDILRRDLDPVSVRSGTNGCLVLSGTLADPYTGTQIAFTRGLGTSTTVQIDHVVALGDSWQKGAQSWSQDERTAFANDPLNLLAVKGSVNESKGDGDTATWLPPNKAIRCTYVARQVSVKAKYALWTTSAERVAMERVLSRCPGQLLITAEQAIQRTASTARVVAPPTPKATPRPEPKASHKPVPNPPAPAPAPAHSFENCTDMHTLYPHGVGRPGARDHTSSTPVTDFLVSASLYDANSGSDRDGDGIACEAH